MILPWWFWLWARWYLGVGEFKRFGRMNRSVRPQGIPYKIPKFAWARLALLLFLRRPASKAYSGILRTNGAWLRNPRGGVEGVKQAWEFGIKWFGLNLNVGDWTLPTSWETVRARAALYGMWCIPWKRVYVEQDVRDILSYALINGCKAAAINLEEEAKHNLPPYLIDDIITAHAFKGEVIIFGVDWLYNGLEQRPGTRNPALNGWEPLHKYAVVLNILPRESNSSKYPAACVAHAHELGFRDVFLSFDGRDPPPSPFPTSWSVYTGDDAAGRSGWYPRG